MKDSEKYRLYLHDLGIIIRERAAEAVQERLSSQATSEADGNYDAGRVMAFNEIISIMQQQAEGFQISLEELSLQGIDPDKDLV